MLLTLFAFSIFSQSVNAKKLVIAHRGASGYVPEHTFSGAVMAYAFGLDLVELGLGFSWIWLGCRVWLVSSKCK